MLNYMAPVNFSNTEVVDFSPYMTPNGPEGEVHWIRESGSDGVATQTGLWRGDEKTMPDSFEINFSGAESILVLEGSLAVHIHDSQVTKVLNEGDIATFEKGAQVRWTRKTPLVKTLMFIAGQ